MVKDTTFNSGLSRGFTLIELMITLVVLAIGVALAVPTYQDVIERRQIEAKVNEVASFMAAARAESVKINRPVAVALNYTNGKTWCLGVTLGNQACDCTVTDTTSTSYCDIEGDSRVITGADRPKASLVNYTADAASGFVFDPVRGTKSAVMNDMIDHDFVVESDNEHWGLRVRMTPTGRIHVCQPAAADYTELNASELKTAPGYKAC